MTALRKPLILTWVCLTLFFVLFPLTLAKPGLPMLLKADEPANYLMAVSLWRDGDLRCESRDLERLFHEFTHRSDNLFLMSEDGWKTVHFSAPLVYPLFAAPAAGLFGANGLIALNAALTMLMVGMGTVYLRRFNRESIAFLFAMGFFLMSCSFVYIFWLQTEVFHMTCVTIAFLLVIGMRRSQSAQLSWLAIAASAASLSLAVYSKPMLAALALPVLYFSFRRRGWKAAAIWCLIAVLTLVLLAGLALTLTDTPWPYLSESRRPVNVSSPVAFMERKASEVIQPRVFTHSEPRSERIGFFLKRFDPRIRGFRVLLDNVGYFLWGRHVGLLLYMPFAGVCLLLFVLHDWRSTGRWLILASLAISTVAFFLLLPDRWHGGGGFIGNRYLVIAYPALLFLVTRIRPSWLIAAGFALGGIFLGAVLSTPFGAPVDHPTLQSHVRNRPFRYFPFELTLARRIPGYLGEYHSGVWFRGRADVFQPQGDELWFHGAELVEAWMITDRPLTEAVFLVRSGAPRNTVEICLEGECGRAVFAKSDDPIRQTVTVTPEKAWKARRSEEGRTTYTYRLTVQTSDGEKPTWRGAGDEDFYLGAAILYLGSSHERDRDLYHVDWIRVEEVEPVVAGAPIELNVEVQNTSHERWPSRGATRVQLSYHWTDADGRTTVRGGPRTPLPSDVPPGETVTLVQRLLAPEVPGDYTVTLDLVREQVAWFSDKDPDSSTSWSVEVVSPD
jgi:hypothetical protein